MTETRKEWITIHQAQFRQNQILRHKEKLPIYNTPWLKLGEVIPALWRLETFNPVADVKDPEADERIKALVGACFLHLADYCNAKRLNLSELVSETLDELERMRKEG